MNIIMKAHIKKKKHTAVIHNSGEQSDAASADSKTNKRRRLEKELNG